MGRCDVGTLDTVTELCAVISNKICVGFFHISIIHLSRTQLGAELCRVPVRDLKVTLEE